MNYYIPYMNTPQPGLLSRIFGNGIKWSTILTNAQKTLNIVNQTIPVIKQMKPVMNNAKTMFKLMNEFKKIETPKKIEKSKETQKKEIKSIENKKELKETTNGPTFFQ